MNSYSQPMLREDALKDKVAIVTGGGSGLGKAMTKYFLQLGAKVVITSRNLEKLQGTAKELEEELRSNREFQNKNEANDEQTGGKVLCVACDVRNWDEVEAMKEATLKEFGRIDILLNNAAGNFISPTERLTHSAFDSILDIVLKGTKNCTLSIGKYWIDNKVPGTVLNIVTTYAWTGSAYVVPSACAKAGVLAMTRSLAVEWGKYNIRFNAIAPGPFPTKGAWDRLLPGDMKDKFDLAKKNPLKRVGEHQELANLAAYLVSDFSSFVNGEVVTIDGGEWLQGAGEFNMLEEVPQEMWDMLENMIKAKKSN